MTTDVWLAGNTLLYLEGAGQLWIHLNWALSLADSWCRVTWVELAESPDIEANAVALRQRLAPFGLDDALRVIVPDDRTPNPATAVPTMTAKSRPPLLTFPQRPRSEDSATAA